MENDYHDMTDRKAHENWIRRECFELAAKNRPFSSLKSTIKRAKEIEKYILDQRPADVVKLVGKEDKNASTSF